MRWWGALALAVGAASCGRHVPGPQEVEDRRTHAFDQAVAHAQLRFGGEVVELDQVVVGADPRGWMEDGGAAPLKPVDERVAGQGAADALYRLADGRLALAGPTCLEGGSCGCDVAISYRYLRRADGKIAVVRLTPAVERIEVEVASCGYGCGQPSPPQPVVAAALPVTEAAQVEVIDEPYAYVRVVETCEHPIPRP